MRLSRDRDPVHPSEAAAVLDALDWYLESFSDHPDYATFAANAVSVSAKLAAAVRDARSTP